MQECLCKISINTCTDIQLQDRLKVPERERCEADVQLPLQAERFLFFLLLLGNLKKPLPLLIQMDWINLILVWGHESGRRKSGRGGGLGCCVSVMRLEKRWSWEGGGGTSGRTGECELNEGRIRMNDDKICCLFPIFSSLRWDLGWQEEK